MNAKFIDLGVKEYGATWELQEEWQKEIIANKTDASKSEDVGYVIFCEHPHVYTLGKSGASNNLLISEEFLKKINATFFYTNRGGDITYHGPQQIVGYPIIDLEKLGIGVKKYIHGMEQSIINTLSDYGIQATRLDGATGVWLDINTPKSRKISAIGVKVSKSVTMHGFAFNVNTDLNYFNHINPCGFVDKGVTSLEKELGEKLDFEEVKQKLKGHFYKVFQLNSVQEQVEN